MPVVIQPAGHKSHVIRNEYTAKDSLDHLNNACRKESAQCRELLQSSFDLEPQATDSAIYPSDNGFVRSAIQAYSSHHHLKIRPEDVWFSILSQLSLWINVHSEEVRGKFVAHQGKKELEVVFRSGNRYTVDYRVFAEQISYLIEESVVDLELREWMMPAFTTTTKHDTVIASILMMGAMQKYFDYKCSIDCGLPSVTLLGEKVDWELILRKLEKLKTFGEEPTQFYELLKPVVSRFVQSFDQPTSPDTIDFWQRIAHFIAGGSGPCYYSGWITAFCFWDEKGKCMYQKGLSATTLSEDPSEVKRLRLDGVDYHRVEYDEVPPGYTSMTVKIVDNGIDIDAMMVGGSVGIKASSSGASGIGAALDTMGAETGWWMFEKKESAEEELYR